MSVDKKIEKYLKEEENIDEPVEKGIYTEEGKKVKGKREAKLFLMAKDKNDNLKRLTWKEYKKLNVPSNVTEYTGKLFIDALMNKLEFKKKVDYNSFVKKDPSFEERVDWLLNNGAKYTKKGLKID